MEQSSCRLSSGPLSQAAQRILAVLQAQRNSNSHRPMERFYDSQREPWVQSSSNMNQEERKDRGTDRPWSRPQVSSFPASHHDSSSERQISQTSADYQCSQTPESSLSSQAASCSSSSSCWDPTLQRETSQTEARYQCSQAYSHRKHSKPPSYQSSQAPSSIQCEAETFSHRDRYNLSLQIPPRLSEHQWRNNTEEIRPSFILSLSPDDRSPDEVLFPTVENPDTHKEEPVLVYQPVSTCHSTSYDTDNSTSGPLKDAKGWNILRNEPEDAVASDTRLKGKQLLSDPTEEATSGGEDGRILYLQSEAETIKTGRTLLPPSHCVTRQETCCYSNSPKLMRHGDVQEDMEQTLDVSEAASGKMPDGEHEIHKGANGVKNKETGQVDATLQNKTGSPDEMKGRLLGTNEITSLGRNLASTASNMDKSFLCYPEVAKSGQKEDNDAVYKLNTLEVKNVEHPPVIESKEIPVGCYTGRPERATHTVNPEGALVQCEPNTLIQCDATADDLDRATERRVDEVMKSGFEVETERRTNSGIHTGTEDEMETEQSFSDVQIKFETGRREERELQRRDTKPEEKGTDRDESVMLQEDREDETSTEDSGRERCPTPTSLDCDARGSEVNVSFLHLHHGNVQTTDTSVSGTSSRTVLAPANPFATGQNSSAVQGLASSAVQPNRLGNCNPLSTFQTHLNQHRLSLSSPLKRKHEALQQQDNALPKICLTRRHLKWKPPCSSQEKARERGVRPSTSIPEHPVVPPQPQTNDSPWHEKGKVTEVHTHSDVPQQTRQKRSKLESTRNVSKLTRASVTCKLPQHKRANYGPDHDTNGSKTSHDWAKKTETLTSDPRVKASGKLSTNERTQMLEKAEQAKTLVLTMVYQDGATQLDPEQKLPPAVCGLLVLMIGDHLDRSTAEDSLGPNDSLVYLKLSEQTPAWAQQHTLQSQELFTRDVLLQVLSRRQLVVCYKAKDLLRTALQFYKGELTCKQVAGCRIQDPQVSGWLLDPADPSSCFQDLLNKHCKRPRTTPALGAKRVSQIISSLSSLYWLNMELCSKLQNQRLWELYSDMELNMIPVLAAMESHHIHVDKEALKRMSDLLGTKMKQLEQEAHRAAGQIFLVTSSTQLRTVLFEKLRLHERCENKKLPKTINTQQQSTSEAALLQLQDLHPLPKIILEYRQIHKIKSTFVDGILSCMMSKNYISSTWYQTSVVTGRISAKHPNFQALPRQPLQITKKQYIQGKEEEVVTVHPRAMFIPQKGCTFLAAGR
ncbi:DNA polymerase nu isoform X3 [Hippoglossus hippoglossus]|uniref:DNA polymerase nu isoform X3 n=1 Tax=Hippoglossus hippoglossus TaxID=8267 RepID=UPI00148D06C9|nr:DNA polymerase nu isoform X3 [Hippoglossus hippoglossus]